MDDNNLNMFKFSSSPDEGNETENKDEYSIDSGFEIAKEEYDEYSYEDYEEDRKERRKSLIKNIIWIVGIVVVSVSIALSVIFFGADYMGIGFGRGKDCTIEIPQGASTRVVAQKLEEVGAVKHPFVFRIYSKLKGYDGQYKYGVYSFNNEAGYESLCQMLMTQGAKAQSVKVTIPEMASIDDIATLLEENGICTKKEFIHEVQNGEFNYDFVKAIPTEKVYYRLEGYLFPDTYDFYNYDNSAECAHLAVEKMLSTLDSKFNKDMREKLKSGKYTFHEIMTMASIVELEAGGSPDEMSNVAAVFFNRLDSADFATLGSSPTIKYPYGDGRYNTYEAPGLPPGPLCSPSLQSIKGTLNPTQNFDYYYFVTDASMKFYYNRTLAQHNSTIAKLQKENNWIYEYFD